MSPPRDLLSILKTRREYCRALLALAQRQNTLIDEHRTADLIPLLEQKQRVINGIARLNELAAEWKQSGQTLTSEQAAEATSVRAEADALFESLQSLERDGVEALTRHRDAIAKRLRETSEVTDGLPSQYRNGEASQPMHLDFRY